MADITRIGILTSGGDCAGLNAVLRAVTHRAVEGFGWQVIGIQQGTAGLMARPVEAEELPPRVAVKSDFYLCRMCPYPRRCWEGAA